MAASTPVFFDSFTLDVGNGVHGPLASQQFKIALTNTEPNKATDTEFADIAELSPINGYTAGGNDCTFVSWSQTDGTAKLVLNNPIAFLASGGDFDTFQYMVLYNSTAPASTGLVFYADHGTPVTLLDGSIFPVTLDAINGVFISRALAAP